MGKLEEKEEEKKGERQEGMKRFRRRNEAVIDDWADESD